MKSADKYAAKPIKKLKDGSVEIFEVYSEKLKKKINIEINHPLNPGLLNDKGDVMCPAPDDRIIRNVK